MVCYLIMFVIVGVSDKHMKSEPVVVACAPQSHIIRLSVWPDSSVFDSAKDLTSAYTVQSKLDAMEFLSFFGLSLYHTKGSKSLIKVRHSKVYNLARFPAQYQVQQEHPMIAGFHQMCDRLVKHVTASYEDKQEIDNSLQVQPKWLNPNKFFDRGQRLIRLFQLTPLVVDHVFQFTENGESNRLIPHTSQIFEKVKSFADHHRLLEHMLRVISNDEAFLHHPKLLRLCRSQPSRTKALFQNEIFHHPPEQYRDELIALIREAFLINSRPFFWDGNVRKKDMFIVRWKVLLLCFSQPDKERLMHLKGGTNAERTFESERHKRLRLDCSDTEDEDEQHNEDDEDNENSDEEEEDVNASLMQTSASTLGISKKGNVIPPFVVNDDVDTSDEEQAAKPDNPVQRNVLRDTEASTEFEAETEMTVNASTIPDSNNRQPCVQPVVKRLEFQKTVSASNVKANVLLLSHTTADNVTKFIELGPLDVIYHRGLDVVPHKVV
jgi:hypothetical protein